MPRQSQESQFSQNQKDYVKRRKSNRKVKDKKLYDQQQPQRLNKPTQQRKLKSKHKNKKQYNVNIQADYINNQIENKQASKPFNPAIANVEEQMIQLKQQRQQKQQINEEKPPQPLKLQVRSQLIRRSRKYQISTNNAHKKYINCLKNLFYQALTQQQIQDFQNKYIKLKSNRMFFFIVLVYIKYRFSQDLAKAVKLGFQKQMNQRIQEYQSRISMCSDFKFKNYRYQQIHQIQIALKAISQFYNNQTDIAVQYLYRKNKHIIVKQNHFRCSLKFVQELEVQFKQIKQEKITKPFHKVHYHNRVINRHQPNYQMTEGEKEKVRMKEHETFGVPRGRDTLKVKQALFQIKDHHQNMSQPLPKPQAQPILQNFHQEQSSQQEYQNHLQDQSYNQQSEAYSKQSKSYLRQFDNQNRKIEHSKMLIEKRKNKQIQNTQIQNKEVQNYAVFPSHSNFFDINKLKINPFQQQSRRQRSGCNIDQKVTLNMSTMPRNVPYQSYMNNHRSKPQIEPQIIDKIIFPPIPPYFYMTFFQQKYGYLFRSSQNLTRWQQKSRPNNLQARHGHVPESLAKNYFLNI